jgi:hypothetical protein
MKKVLAGLLLCVSAVAFAQSSATPQVNLTKRSADCAVQRRTDPKRICTIDIGGEEIDGEKVGPMADFLVGRGSAKHPSLIRVRTSFLPEIVRSTERL